MIVGSGPLADELEALVAELGLQGSVFLTGMQRNPHAIMAKADCFVLSSDYEGQPMVLLEALVLRAADRHGRVRVREERAAGRQRHGRAADASRASPTGMRAFLARRGPGQPLRLPGIQPQGRRRVLPRHRRRPRPHARRPPPAAADPCPPHRDSHEKSAR